MAKHKAGLIHGKGVEPPNADSAGSNIRSILPPEDRAEIEKLIKNGQRSWHRFRHGKLYSLRDQVPTLRWANEHPAAWAVYAEEKGLHGASAATQVAESMILDDADEGDEPVPGVRPTLSDERRSEYAAAVNWFAEPALCPPDLDADQAVALARSKKARNGKHGIEAIAEEYRDYVNPPPPIDTPDVTVRPEGSTDETVAADPPAVEAIGENSPADQGSPDPTPRPVTMLYSDGGLGENEEHFETVEDAKEQLEQRVLDGWNESEDGPSEGLSFLELAVAYLVPLGGYYRITNDEGVVVEQCPSSPELFDKARNMHGAGSPEADPPPPKPKPVTLVYSLGGKEYQEQHKTELDAERSLRNYAEGAWFGEGEPPEEWEALIDTMVGEFPNSYWRIKQDGEIVAENPPRAKVDQPIDKPVDPPVEETDDEEDDPDAKLEAAQDILIGYTNLPKDKKEAETALIDALTVLESNVDILPMIDLHALEKDDFDGVQTQMRAIVQWRDPETKEWKFLFARDPETCRLVAEKSKDESDERLRR